MVTSGDDISIITYGAGVHWAMDYAKNHTDIIYSYFRFENIAASRL